MQCGRNAPERSAADTVISLEIYEFKGAAASLHNSPQVPEDRSKMAQIGDSVLPADGRLIAHTVPESVADDDKEVKSSLALNRKAAIAGRLSIYK